MKFTLDYTEANNLVDFAKVYIDQKTPYKENLFAKCKTEGRSLIVTMIRDWAVSQLFLPLWNSDGDGECLIIPPTKKFNRKDKYVEFEVADNEVSYRTMLSKETFQQDTSNYNIQIFDRGSKFLTAKREKNLKIAFNPDYLSKALSVFDKSKLVVMSFGNSSEGVQITQGPNKSYVLPIKMEKEGTQE